MKEKNKTQEKSGFSKFISNRVYESISNKMPKISQTEQDAIDAGDTWIEADIFNGDINWDYIFKTNIDTLSEKEINFINKKVIPLLKKIDNEKIKELNDLPKPIWDKLKKDKFFAMIIPEEYGGLGFSSLANSTIVSMIASVSSTLAVTVMVPNSLGSAELLLKYGTEEQKKEWLPALAIGKEIPCFALTSPVAGSDAGAITDKGVVVEKIIDGEKTIGIELNFDKRYITLAPVATVMGLAFKLYDPNHLIGDKDDYGITVALIPTNTKGVDNSNRHQPMQLSFMNGTVQGDNVFVPIDSIIGGKENAGKGWRMLVECLSAGRGISLPALSGAILQNNVRIATAYSLIREQFGVSIYNFEGIQESMAKIIGYNYIVNSTRKLTNKALDIGKRPSVITAITKYHATEMARESIKETMDILGGKGIMQGKTNPISDAYSGIPIAITVEGANILTRYLMIFGQGSIRCHKYLLDEINAINNENKEKGKEDFNNIFFKHIKSTIKNSLSAFGNGLTFDVFSATPKNTPLKKYIKQINHLSQSLSSISDITLLSLGGKLKYKEYISSRLGDILSYLFMATAVIYNNSNNNSPEEIRLKEWCLKHLIFKAQEAFIDFNNNFGGFILSNFISFYNFPFGKNYKKPTQGDNFEIVKDSIFNQEFRESLIPESFFDGKNNPLKVFEEAYRKIISINKEIDFSKIKDYEKNNKDNLKNLSYEEKIKIFHKEHLLSDNDYEKLIELRKLILKVINVDTFKK